MRLTKAIIDRAKYEGTNRSRCVLWDDDVRGLGLRIQPSGRKGWILAYRVAGRKRIIALGAYGILTLEEARKRARREMGRVCEGKDPMQERIEARSACTTFGDFAKGYLERHAKVRKASWKDDERRINAFLLPAWGRRRLDMISSADVVRLHQEIGFPTTRTKTPTGRAARTARPYEANRVARLVGKMFSVAISLGYLPEDAPNPARKVEMFEEQERDRFVTPEELPRLLKAIRAEPNPWIRGAILLQLLTGGRKMEILSARWEDVDWQRGELRIPNTKNRKIHHIPLSTEAIAILRDLPREEGNPHVFPGQRAGAHLVSIDKNWRAIRKAAGLDDVRQHDLRRTCGSYLAAGGASLPVIGKVLNHQSASTTRIYARLADDVGRKPLEAHGSHIAQLAGEDLARKLGLVAGKEEASGEAKAVQ